MRRGVAPLCQMSVGLVRATQALHQPRRIDAKCIGEVDQCVEGWADKPPFEAPDVGPMQISADSEIVLRHSRP